LRSTELTPEKISTYDCLLLATDHDDFDYDQLQQYAKILVDTRGRYANGHDNVWQA
jgi:UDP-N-acetyl-D-glucosamine dehydrogenase